ncbi:hypothetical protein ACFLUJ_08605 [Chloroflexota bacterium]
MIEIFYRSSFPIGKYHVNIRHCLSTVNTYNSGITNLKGKARICLVHHGWYVVGLWFLPEIGRLVGEPPKRKHKYNRDKETANIHA